MLWGMIHSFEILAYYKLLDIPLSPNVAIMYGALYDIANFSLLPEDIIMSDYEQLVDEYNTS